MKKLTFLPIYPERPQEEGGEQPYAQEEVGETERGSLAAPIENCTFAPENLMLYPSMRAFFLQVKARLSRFSFRTGVIVLSLCVPCYLISFAPLLLGGAMSGGEKGMWWVVWFGLAKTFQYAGLTILGVEGWRRLKRYLTRRDG